MVERRVPWDNKTDEEIKHLVMKRKYQLEFIHGDYSAAQRILINLSQKLSSFNPESRPSGIETLKLLDNFTQNVFK
jgi:hypothetical protein